MSPLLDGFVLLKAGLDAGSTVRRGKWVKGALYRQLETVETESGNGKWKMETVKS